MPCSGDPAGGGEQATDDGRGALLLGVTEDTGTFQGLRGGDGGCIFGASQDDTSWASGRGEMELGNLGHGGRSVDVLFGLPDQGRPVEMPGVGMSRTSGDEDC